MIKHTENAAEKVFLNIEEAANLIGYSVGHTRLMAKGGDFPYYKKKGKLLFKRSELMQWVETGKVGNQDCKTKTQDQEAFLKESI